MKANGYMTPRDKLLLLIDEACQRFPGAVWMAQRGEQRLACTGEIVLVSGSEDALRLRALERRGLIEFVPELGKYAARITEDGQRRREEILSHPNFDPDPAWARRRFR